MHKIGSHTFTHIITLDAESYYDANYSLKKLTTAEYILRPEWKCFGFGVKLDQNDTVFLKTKKDIQDWFAQFDLTQCAFLGHNMNFDGAVLSWRYNIYPRFFLDTLSMARMAFPASESHSLDAIANMLNVGSKIKDVLNSLSGVRNPTPEQYADLIKYCKNDVNITRRVFDRLVNAVPDSEWDLMHLTTRMFVRPSLQLDESRLHQIKNEEEQKRQQLIADSGLDIKTLRSTDKLTDELELRGVTVPTKINKHGKTINTFERINPDVHELRYNHPDPDIRHIIEARVNVMSNLVSTRCERLLGISSLFPDSLLPIPLNYYGAHTGRWSGADKINAQNFPRAGNDSLGLRDAIRAPDGMQVVVVDLGQIEARMTAWLAGNLKMLGWFKDKDSGREKYGAYTKQACAIFDKEPEDITKSERFVGKTCVLGLGFGLGGPTLFKRLRESNPELGATESECQNWVNIYRQVHYSIPMLWKTLDAMIAQMANPALTGNTKTFKCVRYGYQYVQLPNGCALQYPGLTGVPVETAFGTRLEYQYKYKKAQSTMWGGRMTENLAQSLARILIAEQMLKIDRKYPVATSTHDEIVCVVDSGKANNAYDEIVDIMTQPPTWAPDLPLAADGGVSQYYDVK